MSKLLIISILVSFVYSNQIQNNWLEFDQCFSEIRMELEQFERNLNQNETEEISFQDQSNNEDQKKWPSSWQELVDSLPSLSNIFGTPSWSIVVQTPINLPSRQQLVKILIDLLMKLRPMIDTMINNLEEIQEPSVATQVITAEATASTEVPTSEETSTQSAQTKADKGIRYFLNYIIDTFKPFLEINKKVLNILKSWKKKLNKIN